MAGHTFFKRPDLLIHPYGRSVPWSLTFSSICFFLYAKLLLRSHIITLTFIDPNGGNVSNSEKTMSAPCGTVWHMVPSIFGTSKIMI